MTDQEKLSIEIYKSQKGLPSVKVHFDKNTVWLTQQQMGDLFESSRVNVTEHIKHIYADKELSKKATCRKIRLVRTEGKRQVTRLTKNPLLFPFSKREHEKP